MNTINFQKNHNIAVKLLSVLSISSAIFAIANPVQAVNLVTNGDFSAGASDFTTDYQPMVNPRGGLPPEVFTVDTNPNKFHHRWANIGDHTTGTGNMMIVNGSTRSGKTVWEQTVNVAANTNYELSAWVASVFPDFPAELEFSINSSVVGTFLASATPGEWNQFMAGWNSGTDTSATISIVDLNQMFWGNDFAIDDIALTEANSPDTDIPEPSSAIALAAIGFMFGANALRKRR